jgi:hypothetical protein
MNDDAFSVESRALAANFANQLDGKPRLVALIAVCALFGAIASQMDVTRAACHAMLDSVFDDLGK